MAPEAKASKSIWNHEADKDLLLALIEANQLKNIKWEDVAAKMSNKHTFTKEACRQHFQKIRREAKGDSDEEVGSARAPKTPKKAVTKSTPKAKEGASVSADADADTYDDEDDDEMIGSKKRKRAGVKMEQGAGFGGNQAPVFKMEVPAGGVIDLENDDLYDAEETDYA